MSNVTEFDRLRRPAAAYPDRSARRAWVATAAARLWSALRRAQQRRQTRRSLQALDDLMLKDIGISRSDIEWLSRHEAARERARTTALDACRRARRDDDRV